MQLLRALFWNRTVVPAAETLALFRQVREILCSRGEKFSFRVAKSIETLDRMALVMPLGRSATGETVALLVFASRPSFLLKRPNAPDDYVFVYAPVDMNTKKPLFTFCDDTLGKLGVLSLDMEPDRIAAHIEAAALWAIVHLCARRQMKTLGVEPSECVVLT